MKKSPFWLLIYLCVTVYVLLGGAPSSAQVTTSERTVAVIELVAPPLEEFVVRATVPVPPDTYPRDDGLIPFAVLEHDGTIVPTQMEIVTRYADERDGADVVQVLARVRRPEGVEAGDRIQYEVVRYAHEPAKFAIDQGIFDLLRESRSIILRAHDVFGNAYRADLVGSDISFKLLKQGPVMQEWRVHTSLRPNQAVGGPQATLPHLMGVHAYFRVYTGEPLVQIDLRIHNGHSGLNPDNPLDDPMGKIYFESLELVMPRFWEVHQSFPSSMAGPNIQTETSTVYPILRANGDRKMHFMPEQGQFQRRLTICRPQEALRGRSYAAQAGMAFARRGVNLHGEKLFSWWNDLTARYYTQKHRLPTLDHLGLESLRGALEQELTTIQAAVASGTSPGYPIVSDALGWAHPWGIDHGGQGGGGEITFLEGLRTLATASVDGYRRLEIKHRMYTDRHPMALIDADGEPSSYLDWVEPAGINGPWLPIWHFLTPFYWISDPFGFEDAPAHHVNAVEALGLKPTYEDGLSTFTPINYGHLVRYTNPAKALVWIGNDSLAKDSLKMQAEAFRMSYNDLPNSQYGMYISTGLGADRNYVAEHPGVGFTFGRIEGWGIDATTATYCFAEPEWRAEVRPWFDLTMSVIERGQSDCTGFVQAEVYGQFFQGMYRARQSIEQAIVENAIVGLRESVYRGVDAHHVVLVQDFLWDSFYSFVEFPAWSEEMDGPFGRLAVADLDRNVMPFCSDVPPDGFVDYVDSYQVWSSFAYAYEMTGDPFFLQRATEMSGSNDLLTFLENQGLNNLANRAAILALMQGEP